MYAYESTFNEKFTFSGLFPEMFLFTLTTVVQIEGYKFNLSYRGHVAIDRIATR